MAFTLTTNGLTAMMENLQAAIDLIPQGMAEGITKAAEDTVNLLHDASPVDYEPDNGVIPGEEAHLNESFSADPAVETSVGATADVLTNEPIKYGYVTYGTLDKEPIVPTVQRAMWWPSAPHPMHAVHGQVANDFAQPVAEEVANRGYEYFQPLIDLIAHAL